MILSYKEISSFFRTYKSKRTVLTSGCFDLFHYGHLYFLKNAKHAGDSLIVALESDTFIIRRKGKKPFHSQSERAYMLDALRYVDIVVKLPFFHSVKSYENLVNVIHPHVFCVAANDPVIKEKQIQMDKINGSLKIIKPLPHYSSSKCAAYASIFSN